MFWRKIESKEYLELKRDLESLRISFEGLKMDFELIVMKLKIKYKIRKEPEEETENLKDRVLLPE